MSGLPIKQRTLLEMGYSARPRQPGDPVPVVAPRAAQDIARVNNMAQQHLKNLEEKKR
jgi:hypothetical protein